MILLRHLIGGCLFLCFLQGSTWAQAEFFMEKSPEGFNILDGAGEILIEFPREGFLRVEEQRVKCREKLGSFHFKEKVLNQWEALPPLKVLGAGPRILLAGDLVSAKDTGHYRMEISAADSQPGLLIRLQTDLNQANAIEITFKRYKGPVFGMGEHFSHVNMDGLKLTCFTEEQGIGRGDKRVTGWAKLVGAAGNAFTTYLPVPFWFDNSGKGYFLTQFERSGFNFEDPEWVSIKVHARKWEGRIIFGNTPFDVLEAFSAWNGRPAPLPEWAFGTIPGMQGGARKIDSLITVMEASGIAPSAIWIQDWVGKRKVPFGSRLWWDWHPDSVSYPDFKRWVAEKNKMGIRVLGYINPFLAEEGELAKEALGRGFLVKNEKGEPYLMPVGGFKAYLVDLSHPAARHWLKGVIRNNMMRNGLSGWMADFGEWLPMDAVLENGTPAEWHNRYPVEWAKLNQDVIREAGREKDVIFFSRSGYLGTGGASPLIWAGDQTPDFGNHDGLPSALRALLSSGMSGLPVNHTDLGGYTNFNLPFAKRHRDREIYQRWLELGAFTPVFRSHEGLLPDKNVQPWSDQESREAFALASQWHEALKPYLRRLNNFASGKGWPMVRHMFLHYPQMEEAWNLDGQFMLGPDLLVVPVLERGEEQVTGWFPPGKWEHLFAPEIIEQSGFHTVSAPLGKPAVFLRSDGKNADLIRERFRNLRH